MPSSNTGIISPAAETACAGSDQPTETRMSLVLRPAKLVVDGRELLCLLREVNGSTLKIGLFHPVRPGPVEFELPDGLRLPAILEPHDHGTATLTLNESFHPAMLRKDWSGHACRQVRLNVRFEALLHARETSAPLVIHNISQKGARVDCGVWLRIGEPIRIEARNLPSLHAWVRWRKHPHYGLAFDQTFRLDEIALLCAPQKVRSVLQDC